MNKKDQMPVRNPQTSFDKPSAEVRQGQFTETFMRLESGDPDEQVEGIFKKRNKRIADEEQEKVDVDVRVEAAKYRAARKRHRRQCHILDKMCMFAAGVCFGMALFQLMDHCAWGVMVALIGAAGFVSLGAIFDQQSRPRKEVRV